MPENKEGVIYSLNQIEKSASEIGRMYGNRDAVARILADVARLRTLLDIRQSVGAGVASHQVAAAP